MFYAILIVVYEKNCTWNLYYFSTNTNNFRMCTLNRFSYTMVNDIIEFKFDTSVTVTHLTPTVQQSGNLLLPPFLVNLLKQLI